MLCLSICFASLLVYLSSSSLVQAGRWPASCGSDPSHNFLFGGRLIIDRLAYTVREDKSSSFMRKLSYDLRIPLYGELNGTITYIEVLDQRWDGTGGCVYLNEGGPGYRHVTLHIKSQRNHGVHFIINVFTAWS